MVYKIQPTISPNDRGAAVTNLKAALLFILGNFKKELDLKNDDPLLPAYLKDIKEAAFSSVTKTAVQLFQTKIMKQQNADGIVNDATASKINELLKLTVDLPMEEIFTVHGTVQSSEGFAVAGKTVRAYDKDLRTEELLGECATAANGMYAINYTAAAFTRAEKNNADLFIRVVDEQGVQLQESNIVFNAPAKALIDIVLDKQAYRGLPEFTRYVKELTPVLENQQVEIKALTEDDIKFLGNETGISTQHLSLLAKAYVFGDKQNRMPEVYYGLLRQNLPVALRELLSVKQEELRKALLKSIEQNIVSNSLHTQIDFTLGLLHEFAKHLLTEADSESGYKGIGAVIARSQLSNELKQKFISLYLQHDEAGFATAIAADTELGQEHVQDEIKFAFAAKNITGDDLNLLSILSSSKASLDISKEKDIARLEKTDWIELIKNAKSDIPAEITGSNQEERIANYAATLNDKVEKAYPTQVLAIRLEKATASDHPFGESKNDILTFISNNKDFDVRSTPVSELESENSALNFSNISDKESLKKNLIGIQRMQKITSSYDGIIQLKQNGIDSSLQIAQQTQAVFINDYSDSFGSSDAAKRVYQSATLLYRTSLLLGAEFFPSLHIPVYAMYGSGREHPVSRTSPATWRNIFGSIDGCDCEHCMSVYSPAAYFTDLLHFLETKSPSAFNKLMSRRPDLRHILLNCSNTNTPLPYIDLVNEILELKASDHLTDEYFTSEPGAEEHKKEIQTNWMAEELSANPEHFNASNLNALQIAVYPFSLPYDDALESTRIYLDHLGVKFHELMEVFGGSDLQVATEYFSLSVDEKNILTTVPPPGRLPQYYGMSRNFEDTEKALGYNASGFLSATGITFIELLQLTQCRFLSGLGVSDGCDPAEIKISGLISDKPSDTLLTGDPVSGNIYKIYRFIRLSKKTGLSFYELDQCISSIHAVEIDDSVIVKLFIIKRLQDKYKIPLEELLMLWSDFVVDKTYKDYDADGQPAMPTLFEKLFLNKAVIDPIDPAFLSLLSDDRSGTVPALATHKNTIMASLQISEQDFMLLLSHDEAGLGDSNLAVSNLAILYRHALMSRLLKINIGDLLKMKLFVPSGIWNNSPASVWEFISRVEFMRSSKFSMEEVEYILRLDSALEPVNEKVIADLHEITVALKNVSPEASTETKIQTLVERLIDKLSTSPAIVTALISEILLSVDGIHHAVDDLLSLANIEITEPTAEKVNLYKRLQKICFVINKLKLSIVEVKSIHELRADYGILDVIYLNSHEFTIDQFSCLVQLVKLRDSLPFADKSVFELLDITTGLPDISVKEQYMQMLLLITQWNRDDLIYLIDDWTDGSSIPDEYRNGSRLKKLKKQFEFLNRIGASAEFCLRFKNADDINSSTADVVKNLVKSKYDNKQWLKIAKPLSDQLRTKRRDALVSYLVDGDYSDKHWTNIDELYEYLLIDVQMDACMITSRIKQAISSIQLFMDRVLMNLELDVTFTSDDDAIAFADQWKKWRKGYRIWEANRKIFLYPENWIEPELRDNKSPFFGELENQLLQNEITDETAEDAVRDYLEKLDAVARLEIMGLYHQKEDATESEKSIDILHVFGRTYAEPHIYYYRKLENNEWTAWEKVDLDIQGDHLIPVVWNRRLYLFWPLFMEKAEEPADDDLKAPSISEGHYSSAPKSRRYWEVKLAWSEYKKKKWLAKKTTNDYHAISIKTYEWLLISKSDFVFFVEQSIEKKIKWEYSWHDVEFNFCYLLNGGEFAFDSDINIIKAVGKKFEIDDLNSWEALYPIPDDLILDKNTLKGFDSLRFNRDEEILGSVISQTGFKVLTHIDSRQINFRDTLFYMDDRNTFFVQQNKVGTIQIPGIVDGNLTTTNLDVTKPIFKTFFHTKIHFLLYQLNNLGIDGVFDSGIQKINIYGNLLNPYTPTDSVDSNHPTSKLDFDYDGSYSIYNWELFFHTPLLIATQLNKNQKFEEARKWFHYIFNPTVPSSGDEGEERFWITKPFYELVKNNRVQTLEELMSSRSTGLHDQIVKWESNPFQPHIIARMRLEAYMKTVMMKYIDNLIDWGDQLYRQDTIETINEATQLYVLAAKLLGDRPRKIPSTIHRADRDYEDLSAGLDDFSNALINIESHIASTVSGTYGEGHPLNMFYFCLIPNEKLLSYWDTVADRLFKIRHCMNMEGMVRMLPLFEPPIDPALLVRAAAAGLDLNTVLGETNVNLPNYRFQVMLQKANELCNDVKFLGAALLSAVEKRDAEELSRIRSVQELNMLDEITAMKEKQVEEANENIGSLYKSKVIIEERRNYYAGLEFINVFESIALDLSGRALITETAANIIELYGSTAAMIPTVNIGVSGFGGTPQFTTKVGGETVSNSNMSASMALHSISAFLNLSASISNTLGNYERRKDDWDFQKKVAEREIDQIEKQIAAADIRLAIAEKELENHLKQIENAGKIDEYMRGKFSNQELYEWMKGQIATTYFQTYQLAYDTAKKAEKCFQHELGIEASSYIHFGYWDSLKKGLLSGEKLQYDLRRLENAYLEENKREYEIVKHISLIMLDPLALIKLRSTGSCEFEIPEVLYDMDHAGHYFRRLKSVSISLPCIAGSYTSISAKLSLITNRYRKSNAVSGGYDESAGTDERFIYNTGSIQSIATSNAQNDSGIFELNFRDERYLPFEGTGATSNWQLELPSVIRQFDYSTISDVIIHVKYTAREGGDELKGRVNGSLTASLNSIHQQLEEQGLHIAINMKHDLSNEWHLLKTTGSTNLKIDKSRLPYMTKSLVTSIENVMLLAKVKDNPASFEIHAIINDDNTGIMLQQIPEWSLCNGIMSGIALEQPFSLVVSEDQLNNLEELLLIIKFSV